MTKSPGEKQEANIRAWASSSSRAHATSSRPPQIKRSVPPLALLARTALSAPSQPMGRAHARVTVLLLFNGCLSFSGFFLQKVEKVEECFLFLLTRCLVWVFHRHECSFFHSLSRRGRAAGHTHAHTPTHGLAVSSFVFLFFWAPLHLFARFIHLLPVHFITILLLLLLKNSAGSYTNTNSC